MLFTGLVTGLSLILFLLAAPPYVIDMLRGRTKPERTTWLILSMLGLVSFIAQLQMGATWSLVFMGLDTLSSICVFLLSLRYGEGGWTRLDATAFGIAGLGVVFSMGAHAPLLAVVGSIIADLSATILTLRKTFYEPDSETTISWILVGTGACCSALAVRSLDVQLLLYPVYIALASYSVPCIQLLGRIHQRHMRVTSINPIAKEAVTGRLPSSAPSRKVSTKSGRRLCVDMYEANGRLVIRAPMAAVHQSEVTVLLSGRQLTIRAPHRRRKTNVQGYFVQECSWSEVSRTLTLPLAVEHADAEARLRDGILTVNFYKLRQNTARKISIIYEGV